MVRTDERGAIPHGPIRGRRSSTKMGTRGCAGASSVVGVTTRTSNQREIMRIAVHDSQTPRAVRTDDGWRSSMDISDRVRVRVRCGCSRDHVLVYSQYAIRSCRRIRRQSVTVSENLNIGVKLRSHDLLVKFSGGRFRTTERLNDFMKETHGIDLNFSVRSLVH